MVKLKAVGWFADAARSRMRDKPTPSSSMRDLPLAAHQLAEVKNDKAPLHPTNAKLSGDCSKSRLSSVAKLSDDSVTSVAEALGW